MQRVALSFLALSLLAARVMAEEEGPPVDPDAPIVREYFNPASCFIGFREAMEACVIMSVMLNMLQKTGNAPLKKWVWYGAGAGIVCSTVIGGTFVAVYYSVKATIMTNDGMMIFEGIFSLLASIFLTYLGIGFLRFADIERKWSSKLFTNDVVEETPEEIGFMAKIKAKYGVKAQVTSII
ncbi:iron permease FTR1 family-domain-containing protein [Baffinella frigidus]|nr:iron permease FTR1 family-domain-containing protein [Cryptophyta sp. CCMP2293]